MTSVESLVRRSLSDEAREEFSRRVKAQAAFLDERLKAGDFDNDDFAVGLEVETYAVADDESTPTLRRIPSGDTVGDGDVAMELGVHNAEVNTEPVALRPGCFERQANEIAEALEGADAGLESRLALDGMWTIPPESGSETYLSAHESRDGLTFATNMREDPRYYAIDNEVLERAGGTVSLSVPGADRTFPTILFESLATSIQPHLQLPDANLLPAYYGIALRTMGPLLALSSNSPFLPPDLYDGVADPGALVDRTPHELRIAVFEQSVNYSDRPKVRVPRDLETTGHAIDRVVDDDLYAPFLNEWTAAEDGARFDDAFPEFEHKRGTYWRWLRTVFGGDPVPEAGDERSIRLEYRPLPTQPTVDDVVSLQALTVGLVVGLVERSHPVADLPWETARDNFYAAADDGLHAELDWRLADGARTSDRERLFDEIFEYAKIGLSSRGFGEERIDALLAPIEARWRQQTTPSSWKKARVRERLQTGDDLESAVHAVQREYLRESARGRPFVEW
ncbi:MAG: hypothetical protein ABEJ44_02730 [Halanaeroarchaeum sp.]